MVGSKNFISFLFLKGTFTGYRIWGLNYILSTNSKYSATIVCFPFFADTMRASYLNTTF